MSSFDNDPELRELFVTEVAERVERLVAGARAVAGDDLASVEVGDLYREGHTIKGTARMMGYTAVSEAGKLLEDTWQILAKDGVPPEVDRVDFGAALERLAADIIPAISADPEQGTPALRHAIAEVGEHVGASPAEPEPPTAALGVDGGDLGGLLGAIDDFAFGESVRVHAAGLFRLINGICSLRVDIEALAALVSDVGGAAADPHVVVDQIDRLAQSVSAADKAALDLQGRAIELSATPLAEITNTFPQLVRYLARKSGKELRFELVGDQHSVDRQVLERLADPLRQLLVNSIEHGIEPAAERESAGKPPTATLALRASLQDARLEILIEDDGRGIDWQAVERTAVRRGLLARRKGEVDREFLRSLLFTPAFSTADAGELVGDGNGLSSVAAAVESLHGTITLDTSPGRGTRFMIAVPTSRALQDAVMVTAAGQTWGVPELAVLDHLPVASLSIVEGPRRSEVEWQGTRIPVIAFAEAVGLVEHDPPTAALVVSSPAGPVALTVAEELGRRQVAARELGPILEGAPHLTGAALLGGGDVVVLVDPSRLAERARAVPAGSGPRSRVLVVDDSRGARQVVGGALGSAGFEVDLAETPEEALAVLGTGSFDAIVCDFVLPGMDGAALVRVIRDQGVTVPIVVLSGQATLEDQAAARAAGADAYLDKDDVRQGVLAGSLRGLIDGRRATPRASSQA